MKLLNGQELAEYVKERQAHQVRGLRQAHEVFPKLAIIVTADNPVTDIYVRLKKQYGADILIDVDIHKVDQADARDLIKKLNDDSDVHGIIVQLPLDNPEETDQIINLVAPDKDVDGLGEKPDFEPATPLAIMWLLAGYNIDLAGKEVLIIGRGKLVGAPLKKLLIDSGIEPKIASRQTADLKAESLPADVIITATGVPGLIKPDMLKPGVVLIDAGTASEGGKTLGDVAPEVYEECDNITVTPAKGGVGPLTVCALFDNVIRSAQRVAEKAENNN